MTTRQAQLDRAQSYWRHSLGSTVTDPVAVFFARGWPGYAAHACASLRLITLSVAHRTTWTSSWRVRGSTMKSNAPRPIVSTYSPISTRRAITMTFTGLDALTAKLTTSAQVPSGSVVPVKTRCGG